MKCRACDTVHSSDRCPSCGFIESYHACNAAEKEWPTPTELAMIAASLDKLDQEECPSSDAVAGDAIELWLACRDELQRRKEGKR